MLTCKTMALTAAIAAMQPATTRAAAYGADSVAVPAVCANTAQHAAHGQGQAPGTRTLKTNAPMAGIGAVNLLDTYLSTEKYRGTGICFLSYTRRERNASPWFSQFQHEGNAALANNRTRNGGTVTAAYTFRYSLMHKWAANLWHRQLQLNAGGTVAAHAGFVYNTRNGNNPANARLALHIEPTVGIDCPLGKASAQRGMVFRPESATRFPLILHYEASAPLAGLMFSPNYGQSYYEMFNRGNYDHNCVPTSFVSTPSFRQMLAVDVRLARATFRIGYLGTIEQTKVNQLKTHNYTHALMIGIVKRFRTVKL